MFNTLFPKYWSSLKKITFIKSAINGLITLRGNIVSFNASEVTGIKSLSVAIEPQQSGSGDPSPTNVRPFTGRTGAKVWVKDEYNTSLPETASVTFPALGKNLFDKSNVTDGYYLSSDGTPTSVLVWCYSDYIPVSTGNYIASGLSAGGSGTYCCIYDSSKNFVRSLLNVANQNLSFSIQDGEAFVRLSVRKSQNEIDTAMFEKGTSATPYQPYTNTVYSGTFGFVSGEGNNNKVKIILGGGNLTRVNTWYSQDVSNQSWGMYLNRGNDMLQITSETIVGGQFISNKIKDVGVSYGNRAAWTGGITINNGSMQYLGIRIAKDALPPVSSAEELASAIVSYLNSNPIEFLVKVAPKEFSVTPQPINTLQGENHAWSDAGNVTLTAKGITPIE